MIPPIIVRTAKITDRIARKKCGRFGFKLQVAISTGSKIKTPKTPRVF
jgi:hypothetical protein